MSAVLLLSNGHGEDLSAAALGSELLARGLQVVALPLVGQGRAYQQAGIAVLGATRDFSTGGLGYTSLAARLTDVREGQFTYVIRLLALLWRQRRRFDLVVAVGDLVPVLGAWLSGRDGVVYLVAYSSHYEGRLRLPWPCGWLLRRPRIRAVWSRDQLTAADLSAQLARPVRFLGNPFLDGLLQQVAAGHGAARLQQQRQSVAVLPGSRLPEALDNLALLLRVLAELPSPPAGALPLLRAALVSALTPAAIAAMAAPLGWRLEAAAGSAPAAAGRIPPPACQLRHQTLRLELHWEAFEAVLGASDLVLAMSGTASEQAVALGLPVLQVAGRGPQFTAGFAEAQRRLLGPGVVCDPGPVGAPATLAATATLLTAMLQRLADPLDGVRWRAELAAVAAERLGTAGGSARMAAAIMDQLAQRPSAPRCAP
ncbi:MAG: lipid-A-disaccharide synthase-related protein [Cyanobium sp.]